MVDIHAQIDAVSRGLVTRDDAEVRSRVQTLGQTYATDIADLWDAVTTPDRIRRWFLPLSGDLRIGGHYQLEGNAGGTIQECVPPQTADSAAETGAETGTATGAETGTETDTQTGASDVAHFTVTWEYGGGAPTWLTVRLTALGPETTRLELEHIGRLDDFPEEMWTRFGPSATGIGWDMGLLGLALHVSGAPDGISPAEAAAWQVSEEGKQFSRLSADAWARAHVADGATPEQAEAAATTTWAMYAGEAAEPAADPS